jgi:hypothetical protein
MSHEELKARMDSWGLPHAWIGPDTMVMLGSEPTGATVSDRDAREIDLVRADKRERREAADMLAEAFEPGWSVPMSNEELTRMVRALAILARDDDAPARPRTLLEVSEIGIGRDLARKAGLEGRFSDDELGALMRTARETFGEVRYRPDGTPVRVWPEETNDPRDIPENRPIE